MRVGRRVRAPIREVLRRRGYRIVRDPPAPESLFPGPPFFELAAHQVMLRAVLETRAVNCVVDAGANEGGFGTMLREIGYREDIVSFEPGPAAFAVLSARTESDPRWHAHQLALGDMAGQARLHVARGTYLSSFLRPNDLLLGLFEESATERDEDVDVQRLDAVFDQVVAHVPEPRVLLKTDTQGWDMRVIEGARGCLDRIVALQVELAARAIYDGATPWLEALAFLADLGFIPAHMSSANRDPHLGVIEFDGLFIREQSREPRR